MKIVITASGETKDAPVDPRFGRARYFILYDTETGALEAFDNAENLNAAHGAGTQSAENVSRMGAECVISGRCGPKAFEALTAAGIKVFGGAEGTVADAIAAFEAGKLTQL